MRGDLNVNFGFVNIRSINKNFQYLEQDSTMLKMDVIFLTETWKDAKHVKTYELDGFESAFANGKSPMGKGVGVFFRKDARIEICQEELFQFIKFQHPKVTIFCLYITKGCNYMQLIQALERYDFNKDTNTCSLGHLNFDASESNHLTRYLSKLQFTQSVGRATHLHGHILDQFYASEAKTHLYEIKHHFVYYSDHDGILINLKKITPN